MGCSDREACLMAGISHTALYDYCNNNPEYTDRKETLKTNPVLQAKRIQLHDLTNNDSQIAQKVIERKEGKKLEVAGPGGGALMLNFNGVGNGPSSS